MNEDHALTAGELTPAPQRADMSASHAPLSDDSFVPGRRDFLRFRDLGVAAASNGRTGAVVIEARQGMVEPTGWHYHECESQTLYMLRGWADMQLEDGRQIRLDAGGCLFLPGGFRHNEIATSDDMMTLEVTVPAEMGTVACEPPESWTADNAG